MNAKQAEDLARVALQGFFDDPTGFGDMKSSPRTKAKKRIEEKLGTQQEADVALLSLALNLAKARRAHDEAKSDSSRNIATGQALYAAQRAFDDALDKLARPAPDVLPSTSERST